MTYGQEALQHLQAHSHYYFQPSQFAALVDRGLPREKQVEALYRLTRSGRAVCVTRQPPGYLLVPADHAKNGAPPITWWLDACMQSIDPHYYVGLLSAARHWNGNTAPHAAVQVIVSQPHPPLTPGQLRVTFTSKARASATPVTVIQEEQSNWRVSTRAATLLDLLRHPARVGGLEEILRHSCDWFPEIGPDELFDALECLGQAPAAQRAGFLLEHLQQHLLAQCAYEWLCGSRGKLRSQPLDTAVMRIQSSNSRRWQIRFDTRQVARF
jgi:predicted transcriptional regulator of viral defense system